MEKEIICKTLEEAFDYIEQHAEEGVIYTIELTPEGNKKEEVANAF